MVLTLFKNRKPHQPFSGSSAFYHPAQDEDTLRWGFPTKPAETHGIGNTSRQDNRGHGCSPEGLLERDVVQKFEKFVWLCG